MAIGDPWDSSYDPRENGLDQYDWMLKKASSSTGHIKNNWTYRHQWGPDHSYLVPQGEIVTDSSGNEHFFDTIHDRRGGRFCTQGCGCIEVQSKTSRPFQDGSTILPQDLAIQVFRTTVEGNAPRATRHDLKSILSNEHVVALRYSNGAWRGRGEATRFFDRCTQFTGENCHFATSRFKFLGGHENYGSDYLDPKNFNEEFEGSINDDGIWQFTFDPKVSEFTSSISYDTTETRARYEDDTVFKTRLNGVLTSIFSRDEEKEIEKGFQEELEMVGSDPLNPSLKMPHLYTEHEYCSDYHYDNEADCIADGNDWLSTHDTDGQIKHIYRRDPRIDSYLNFYSVDEDGFFIDGYNGGYLYSNGPLNDGSTSQQESPRHCLSNIEDQPQVRCVKDGFTPRKKKPYCKDPITGYRLEEQCEVIPAVNNWGDDISYQKCWCTRNGTCDAIPETLNGDYYVDKGKCENAADEAGLPSFEWTALKWGFDEQSCIAEGICEAVERHTNQIVDIVNKGTCSDPSHHTKTACSLAGETWTPAKRSDYFIEPRCVDSNGNRAGGDSRSECETAGNTWLYADKESCESIYGESIIGFADAFCVTSTGNDPAITTRSDCEAAGGEWFSNKFTSNIWEQDEYEPFTCCGSTILDQNSGFRTPIFSGSKTTADGLYVKDSNLENPVCITPVDEYTLLPPDVPAVNIYDRRPIFQKELILQNKNPYWTLIVRPASFYDSCFNEGYFIGDNKARGACYLSGNLHIKIHEITNRKDCIDQDYYWFGSSGWNLTCGEELVLKIPTNQMLNDSNFNLTMSDDFSRYGKHLEYRDTKKDMSFEPLTPFYFKETQPSWDLKFGLFDKVYEWWNEAEVPKQALPMPTSSLNGPFPADSMHDYVYDWWCRNPDANFDGIADGASGHDRVSQEDFCNNYVYPDPAGGAYEYTYSLNPKGASTFAKFNLQPQPFKATEERQLRAKTIQQAKVDYAFWFDCVGRGEGAWAGESGHWFVNYGQDYFLYFDFDENKGEPAYDTYCENTRKEFNTWVKTHIGHLSRGTCSSMAAIGWVDKEPNLIDEHHPCGFPYTETLATGGTVTSYGCGGFDEATCSNKGYCENADGTFDNTIDQASCTGTWKECCEYFKRCIGPDGALDARVVIGVNAFAEWEYGHVAANKQECERDINSAINGGPPGAGGTWEEGCGNKNEPTNCNDVSGIPNELADIVFGERIGDCDVSSGGSTTTTSETKEDCDNKSGTWTQRKVGHYDERISPYIKVAKGIGQSADYDVEVLAGIKDGQQDLSVIQNAINDEIGTSPDYWQNTGLYPAHETQTSYVSDSCLGTKAVGRVQFVSNEVPMKVTSPSHNLIDGDKVDIRGVLGNFAANVITNKEWQEMQWEEKKYKPWNAEQEEKIINPAAVCPYESDGTCDETKYYACDGQVVNGKLPDPAPFFIARNVTSDTFDLYTCNKEPADGLIEECYTEKEPFFEWYSVYGHMENITLKSGDIVSPNDVLGTVSDIGADKGWFHLQFAVGEVTDKQQPNGRFAANVVNGISFDTGFSGGTCLADYPNSPRNQTSTESLTDMQIAEIGVYIDFSKLLEQAPAGSSWIDGLYSTDHVDEAYWAVDLSTHTSATCSSASLIAQSANGRGKKVYNPFPDSDMNGNQIVTQVAGTLAAEGLVVLHHHVPSRSTEGTRGVQVWKTCPFTGKWETYGEPMATMLSSSGDEIYIGDQVYRPGWSFNSKRWDYRANDYYVAIEQKGICPVCNDHYIPENLTATLTTVDSEYLNVAGCTINPCYEPNVCVNNKEDFDILYGAREFVCIELSSGDIVDKPRADCIAPDYEWKQDAAAVKTKCIADGDTWVGDDWWNYSTSEGYCCSDKYHKCEGSGGFTLEQEIEDCKEQPHMYGMCERNNAAGIPVPIAAYTPQQCADQGGAFNNPLTTKDQCEKFLRRRINENGTTNCRRCADVFTNENGVPLKDKVDDQSGYFSKSSGSWITHGHSQETTPLDKNGKTCCGSGSSMNCDCIADKDRFPKCQEFIQVQDAKGVVCYGKDGVAGLTVNMGSLTAVCVEVVNTADCANAEAGFQWQPDGMGGGEWEDYSECSPSDCTPPTRPTQASHPPADPTDIETIFLPCGGGTSEFHWEFDPCSCFPNNIAAKCECDKMHATDMWGEISCEEQGAPKDSTNWYHDNSAIATCCGAIGDSESTINQSTCYDMALAHEPIDSTCPGLDTALDVPMEYDGQVWRSEWTLMDKVGTKQCQLGSNPKDSQRWHFASHCIAQPTPPTTTSLSKMVYTNADCRGCDMPQSGVGGVYNKTGDFFRDVREPKLPEDGHFIRLVLGCGNAIPSIELGGEGELNDGGMGPSPSTYQSESMKLWAEITNCSYHNGDTHDLLRTQRVDQGVDGNPPCMDSAFGFGGCTEWEHYGRKIEEAAIVDADNARPFMFAGKCVSRKNCGPKGPCVNTECCTYEGNDQNYLDGNIEGALWSGSKACSTGGHVGRGINNLCQTVGFEMGPDKRKEVLTVHDIIDVNHITGEGTLVAKSKGGTCSYSAGTTVSIGMAGPAEAESNSKDDYTRNKHAANPFLRGTVLTETIATPKFEEFDENGKSIGYARGDRAGHFIYIKVKDITPLINKNSRKDRHLKYNDLRFAALNKDFDEELLPLVDEPVEGTPIDPSKDENRTVYNEHIGVWATNHELGSAFSPTRSFGVDSQSGIANKSLKYPYGNNPYPVATQTISGTVKSQMWPKGKVMSPDNLESLRVAGTDAANDIEAPGRTGRLWRDYYPIDPVHSIVDSSFFGKKKDTAIESIENIYHPLFGACLDNQNYTNRKDCEDNGHLWMPEFLNTVVGVPESDGFLPHGKNPDTPHEKIMISGTIAYKATCKGSSLGYCFKPDGSGKGKNINECKDKTQFTDNIAGEWVQAFTDEEADKHICEDVFGGQWVIGIRNPDTASDPENNSPSDLPNRERDFEAGCPPACQLKGFYTDKACVAFQSEVTPGESRGECYECISDDYVDSNGDTQEFIQCPLTPFDGNHVAVKSGKARSFREWLTHLDIIETLHPEARLKSSSLGKFYEEYINAFKEKILSPSGPIKTGIDYYALADEEHITVNNEAKLNINSKYKSKVEWMAGIDYLGDNTFDPTHNRQSNDTLWKHPDECRALPNHYSLRAMLVNAQQGIFLDSEVKETFNACINLDRFDHELYSFYYSNGAYDFNFQYLAEGHTLFSAQHYYKLLVNADRLDWFTTGENTPPGPVGVLEYTQLKEACELSDLCHFEKVSMDCRGGDPNDIGICKSFTGSEDFVTTFPTVTHVTEENCPEGSIFTPELSTKVNPFNRGVLERHEEKACLEAGHQVIPMFLCHNIDPSKFPNQQEDYDDAPINIDQVGKFIGIGNVNNPVETILTPQECEAAGGQVFYDGILDTASRKRHDLSAAMGAFEGLGNFKEQPNMSDMSFGETNSKYKSRDFITKGIQHHNYDDYKYKNEFGKITYNWGRAMTDVAITAGKRRWKGLIYAHEVLSNPHMSQKDKEAYSKYVVQDPARTTDTFLNFYNGGPAYWSRHGGAFDVTISQKLPENKAMDNNSDKPINLEFWLNFPQICCNLRGPANYWGCPDDCFPTANGSQGPVLEHLQEIYGIDGQSLIKVNITESSPIKGGGGEYFDQGFHN